MRHKTSGYYLLLILAGLLVAASCKKTSEQAYISNNYSGSGAPGDVLTFTVNESVGGYTVYNESNKQYVNGSFTTYTGDLNGLFKVYTNGAFYYSVEMPGQVFTGNFPTGRLNNDLSYGVSQQSDATSGLISGNYVYMHISRSAVNGSSGNREWGILSVYANGTWTKQGYCNDTGSLQKLMPDEYTAAVPPVNPADSGTWIVDPIYSNKLIMNQFHSTDTLTGFPIASDTGAVFIMDLGYGHGFLIGLKLLDGDLNKIRGNYGYSDVRFDAGTGGGKFSVNDSSYNVQWWRADSYAKIRNGTFGALNQCTVLKNVFYARNIIFYGETVDYFAFVSGPYFMEFQFMNNKFRSYGLGARLP
ncbi:MAG: hypothetical protein NTU51_09195 [Bacteroidetes bacterium]|nr:hypothetical protein [Bacteroidota bacterium]